MPGEEPSIASVSPDIVRSKEAFIEFIYTTLVGCEEESRRAHGAPDFTSELTVLARKLGDALYGQLPFQTENLGDYPVYEAAAQIIGDYLGSATTFLSSAWAQALTAAILANPSNSEARRLLLYTNIENGPHEEDDLVLRSQIRQVEKHVTRTLLQIGIPSDVLQEKKVASFSFQFEGEQNDCGIIMRSTLFEVRNYTRTALSFLVVLDKENTDIHLGDRTRAHELLEAILTGLQEGRLPDSHYTLALMDANGMGVPSKQV